MLACLILCSCSREYVDHATSISPDGRHIIDITREIQAANDPDVFWQHISIRPATNRKAVTPGNVAIYSCHSKPVVTWKSSSEVQLSINKSDAGNSFDELPKSKIINSVSIVFVFQ